MKAHESGASGSAEFSGFMNVPVVYCDDDGGSEAPELPQAKDRGTLPTESRVESIFLRIVRQLDYLYRTADMMNSRLDDLQAEIDDLVRQNVE